MRLGTILADYSKEFFDALAKKGISTPEELLRSKSDTELFLGLIGNGSISYQDLKNAREKVTRAIAAQGHTARELLVRATEERKRPTHWSTGLSELDGILRTTNRLVEIAGGKGSGKTTLTMNVAVSFLRDAEDSVVHWVDTTGDFSAVMHPNQYTISNALERLHVSLAFDYESAHDVLRALHGILQSMANSDEQGYVKRLLVIDPITPLFATMLDPANARGHALVCAFMRSLRLLAANYPLTVLITNNATDVHPSQQSSFLAFAYAKQIPALGPSFTFLTDTTVWLARVQDVDLSGESRGPQNIDQATVGSCTDLSKTSNTHSATRRGNPSITFVGKLTSPLIVLTDLFPA